MFGTQVIGHLHKRVAVDLHAAAGRFLNEIAAHRVVLVAVMIDEIIYNRSFSRTQGARNADDLHVVSF